MTIEKKIHKMCCLAVFGIGIIIGCSPGGGSGGGGMLGGNPGGGGSTTRYSCSGNSCVASLLGAFTTSTCDNMCVGGVETGCTLSGATMTTAVSASEFAFAPSCVTVISGATITWTNNGSFNHTVTSDPGDPAAFDSGIVIPGGRFSYAFTLTGTYNYHCSFHQVNGMTGTVIVQ